MSAEKTVRELAGALADRGYRVEVVEPDGDLAVAWGVNVWPKSTPAARYPWTTVWAPVEGREGDGWLWGPNFEYGVPDSSSFRELVDAVERTVPKATT